MSNWPDTVAENLAGLPSNLDKSPGSLARKAPSPRPRNWSSAWPTPRVQHPRRPLLPRLTRPAHQL